jgi:hypothetical protein
MIGEWTLVQGDGISCLSIDWTVLLSYDMTDVALGYKALVVAPRDVNWDLLITKGPSVIRAS